jgi:hypothetical protein
MALPWGPAIGGKGLGTTASASPSGSAIQISPPVCTPAAIACFAVGQQHHHNEDDYKPDRK